jgi:uncharacterized protein YndB with AHSA1/START domain
MSQPKSPSPHARRVDPDLDLVLERTVDVAPELVWKAWTEPERLKQWFTPKPWKTIDAEIDLRPGGVFRTVMQSPEGEVMPEGKGCVLEVVPNRRFTWTGALGPDFRPNAAPEGGFLFTATIAMEPAGKGTRYTAHVMHTDPKGKTQHEQMGFHAGWGAAFDQLVALAKTW